MITYLCFAVHVFRSPSVLLRKRQNPSPTKGLQATANKFELLATLFELTYLESTKTLQVHLPQITKK